MLAALDHVVDEAREQEVFCCEDLPTRTAFGFLHLVAHGTRRTGALGWFYADPSADPPAVVGAVAGIFDSVVRPTDDGWRSAREYRPANGADAGE